MDTGAASLYVSVRDVEDLHAQSLLDEGGVSRKAAAWGVDVLLLLPTASAVEHAPKTPSRTSHDLTALAAQIAAVDPRAHPHIAAAADDLLSGGGEARRNWALDVLIAGIVALSAHDLQQE